MNHQNRGLINHHDSQAVSNWCLSPVWEISTGFDSDFNKKLFEEIYLFYKNIDDELAPPCDLVEYDAPIFSSFKNKILLMMSDHFARFTNEASPSSIEEIPYDFSSAWLTIQPPGQQYQMHVHPNAILTGTYYLNTPENCGNLVLIDTQDVAVDPLTGTVKIIDIVPKEGNMVFFPAYVMHEVRKNESKQVRISLTFDLNLKNKNIKITDKSVARLLVGNWESFHSEGAFAAY